MNPDINKALKETTVVLVAHEIVEKKVCEGEVYELKVIAAALGRAISDCPELLGQMLEEMGYSLYRMTMPERAVARQKILKAASHRGHEVLEFLVEEGAA